MKSKSELRRAGARLSSVATVAVLALTLAGCAATDRIKTGSIGRSSPQAAEAMTGQELASAVEALGRSYARDPKDMDTAMRYASVLQMNGRTDQALAVMRKLAIDYPRERQVLAAYGKALASAGELEAALDAVRRAQTPEYPDWKLLSAEGAILDQVGKSAEARELYRKALQLQPGEASVLSNYGMSFLLEGDLKNAETQMRQASQAPGADSRVRQNLALVVGLQGRFKEAEEIASRELSPEQAQANVTYLRQMLAQQNSWNQLRDEERNTN